MGVRIALLLVTMAMTTATAAPDEATFTSSQEFGPVRFSRADLVALVNKVRAAAEASGPPERRPSQHLSLGDGSATLDLNGTITEDGLSGAPEVATNVRYRYHNDTPDAPISSVTISLSDFLRQVEISGRSRDRLDLAAASAGKIMAEHTVMLGGSRRRFDGGFCLVMLGPILSLIVILTGGRLMVS